MATGIATGGFVCILVLTIVSLTIRKCASAPGNNFKRLYVRYLKKDQETIPFSVSLFQVTVVFDERAAMVFIALEVEGRSTKEALAIQVRILECH